MDTRDGSIHYRHDRLEFDEVDRQFMQRMVVPPTPRQRAGMKVRRNDNCPCGSGRKFKRCCMFRQRSGVGRCEVSAEIPGQVSEREIVEANYAVIAERDELRQQLAASQAREAELREACDLLRVVALPPVGVSGRVAVNSSSDISSDEEREWAELEKLGPRGTDLIKFAKLNLPPQEWYDEAELRAWKESAIAVTPPLQEIAKELGVPLGESIHDKILPGVKLLKAKIAVLRQCVELYAEEKNWLPADTAVRTRRLFNLIGSGYESAQAALAMVEGMK